MQDKGVEGSPQAHLSRACLPAWFSHSISGGQCLITFFSPFSTYILRTVSEFSLLVFYCKFKLLCYFSHMLHLKTYLVLWFKSLAISKGVLKLINRWEIYWVVLGVWWVAAAKYPFWIFKSQHLYNYFSGNR